MSSDKQTPIRKRIGAYYIKYKHLGKIVTVNHFVSEGISKTMVYDTIKKVDNGLSLERSPGSGSHHAIPQKIKDKIIEENVNEIGRTYRSIGRDHKIDDKTAKDILIKTGIRKKKRIKATSI